MAVLRDGDRTRCSISPSIPDRTLGYRPGTASIPCIIRRNRRRPVGKILHHGSWTWVRLFVEEIGLQDWRVLHGIGCKVAGCIP